MLVRSTDDASASTTPTVRVEPQDRFPGGRSACNSKATPARATTSDDDDSACIQWSRRRQSRRGQSPARGSAPATVAPLKCGRVIEEVAQGMHGEVSTITDRDSLAFAKRFGS